MTPNNIEKPETESELSAARCAVAAGSAVSDTDRLNWLDDNLQTLIQYTEPSCKGDWFRLDYKSRTLTPSFRMASGKTIRETIDAAMGAPNTETCHGEDGATTKTK